MNNSIAVIIPTFNRWPILQRAVDSVLAQTQQPDEIIIVDDGSTDNTSLNLKQYYADKVTVLVQPNRGVSAARNIGITKAKSHWIALLDSDDAWLSDKLQQQTNLILNNENCVLCHTDEIWVRNGVRVNQMDKHKKSGGDIFENCLPLCAISPSSALIKQEVFKEIGYFDESLPACEDYDLWLRLCAKYEVHYIDSPMLTKYGGHEDQLSRKHWGMDRFRITALHKLLTQSELTESQRQLTLNMLEHKTIILLKGAFKHNNQELIKHCHSVLRQHKLPLPDSPK